MLWKRRRLLTLVFTFFIYKTATSQIPIGSRLSIAENNYWISPNGNFAIGFFNHSDQYSIGIRFNSKSIPNDNQAIVWIAGGNLVVGDQSYFEFRENGEFVLFDSIRGSIAWATSNRNASTKPSANLLDNGNLVILSNGDMVWQSFNDPSDTLLPGQNLSVSNILRAASGNSLSSYYSLRLDDYSSGKLQLQWERNTVYWENVDNSNSIITRAILDINGRFQILDDKSRVVWSVFADDHNDSAIEFRFLRLDIDGNLRLYSWVNVEKKWSTVWRAVHNQCDVFATCGLNGLCAFNSSFGSFSTLCRCVYSSENVIGSKCIDCKFGSMTTVYKHTTLYGIYPPNETIVLANEKQCEDLCRNDSMCTAATFVNNGNPSCRLLKTRYISGKFDPSLNSVSFVKKCINDPIAARPETPTPTPSSFSWNIAYIIGFPTMLLVLLVPAHIVIAICIRKRNDRLIMKRVNTKCLDSKGLTIFSYSEIEEITESFKHRIGPKMFKGKLMDNNNNDNNKRLVAVKDANNIEERKFVTVMSRIGAIHHKSLVKVEGYCSEQGQRYVVYEHAKNGSLNNCMEKLTWRNRIEIGLTIAKAVSYLHSGCREFIAHGNLKLENVVLDENFEAKVGEFGFNSVYEKDVEDFGMILLSLISGREDDDDDGSLRNWAYEKWLVGHGGEIVDGRIIEKEGVIDLVELERLLRIAFWCLPADERFRCSMVEVVNVLEGNLAVDKPPPPRILLPG
ncbi:G-type lectin S-receptor-like serine/threonine-protein kinase SD3-1 [Impatiens glandulifera]|uniref:G-type lectin S-receptor-like serine/threonine-protein kinase SD3-1 n=1 Tax=Impatiens glandulifera TaxID=253017 RepID=UPI001FB19626|nr:G-type lectin S-receptor-like serine/threonine-protein kinase SD3-1 [Impatiens glandulifera]